jgi:integrase/recombinase XerD
MTIARDLEACFAAAYSRGLSETTIKNQRSHLGRFANFLEGQDVTDAAALTREVIEQYMDELSWAVTRRGKPMKLETRNVQLWSIKSFCRWLLSSDRVAIDPSEKVPYARKSDTLPKSILTTRDMEKLLAAPSSQSVIGFRDRVVLELLYSTALRVNELIQLDVGDLDLCGGDVRVKLGKGSRDRVAPAGRLACELTESYLREIRPQLLEKCGNAKEEALILSQYGNRLGRAGIAKLIDKHAKAAGIKERVTPHTFRHSCATHMLRGGANVRHLQEMLGHKQLTSTEVYTRVTITELKEVHKKFHPRGNVDEADVRKASRRKKQ